MGIWATSLLIVTVLGSAASAQVTSAPDWCVDFLKTKPAPTPIVELFNIARGRKISKGQFETTPEFQKRSESRLAAQKESLETAFGSSHVVVELPISSKYDADKGRFTVQLIHTVPFRGIGNVMADDAPRSGYDAVTVLSRSRSTDSYEGQTAYGVTKTVTREFRDEYGLALINLRLDKKSSWLVQELFVPMAPENAAAIGGKLSVLIVSELIPPGTIEGFDLTKPTLQNPKETIEEQRFVTVNAVCGGIVARGTRELLQKLN